MCCHKSLLEELSLSCVTPLGEDSWNLASGFLRVPHVPFPFAEFALFPFAVMSNSPGYNYMLSPGSPPSESLKLGVVLGTPNSNGKLFSNHEPTV